MVEQSIRKGTRERVDRKIPARGDMGLCSSDSRQSGCPESGHHTILNTLKKCIKWTHASCRVQIATCRYNTCGLQTQEPRKVGQAIRNGTNKRVVRQIPA